MTLPGGTKAPAPMMLPRPTTALSITMAPIPTNTSSSMVQPWRMTRWPTVTRLPTVVWDSPRVAWTMVPSWMLVSSPMRMEPWSPRNTTPGQRFDDVSNQHYVVVAVDPLSEQGKPPFVGLQGRGHVRSSRAAAITQPVPA